MNPITEDVISSDLEMLSCLEFCDAHHPWNPSPLPPASSSYSYQLMSRQVT